MININVVKGNIMETVQTSLNIITLYPLLPPRSGGAREKMILPVQDLWANELVSEASKSSIVWCSHDVRVVIRLKLYVCSIFFFFSFFVSFCCCKQRKISPSLDSLSYTAHSSRLTVCFFFEHQKRRLMMLEWWVWPDWKIYVFIVCLILFFSLLAYISHAAHTIECQTHTRHCSGGGKLSVVVAHSHTAKKKENSRVENT